MKIDILKHQYYTKPKGFTLVEMAIVLVIFGLLLAMFISPLAAQKELRSRAKTQVILNQAKEALMGYALSRGYLPCPDTAAIPDGVEDRNSDTYTCASSEGILPWNELGVEGTDAWNHYLKYRVDSTFSNKNPANLFTISNANNGNIVIYAEDPSTSIISSGGHLAAAIISFGANGYGATNTNKDASTNKQPAPTGVDELENTNVDENFISHPPTVQGSTNGEFDDMLIWISPKVLINRMIMAERLP